MLVCAMRYHGDAWCHVVSWVLVCHVVAWLVFEPCGIMVVFWSGSSLAIVCHTVLWPKLYYVSCPVLLTRKRWVVFAGSFYGSK